MTKRILGLLGLIVCWQLLAVTPARAACSCIADPYSKKYLVFKKTWYGTKRTWTCVYTCQDNQQNRTDILGTHDDWFMSDKGLEGICDGLHYVNTYLPHTQNFAWVFKEARWFNPADASAPETLNWSKQNCR